MASDQTDLWAVLEVIGTAVAGVWAGVQATLSWFTKREAMTKQTITEVKQHVDVEIKSMRDRIHLQGNTVNNNTLAIAVMQTQHAAVTERLSKIERCVEKVSDKQDEQMELSRKIYREKT